MARRNEGRETWFRLREWDKSQADSERLAARILSTQGFENIDPSHPLGGRDNLKDIVLSKGGQKWICSVYFPRGQQRFSDIKSKFSDDFKGVSKNNASGFIFFTNQELTLGEREAVINIKSGITYEIFHLERVAALLDMPINFGLRLDFLEIEMSREEQLSFFDTQRKMLDDFGIVINKLDTFINNQGLMGKGDIPLSQLVDFRKTLFEITQQRFYFGTGMSATYFASPISLLENISLPIKELRELKNVITELTEKKFELGSLIQKSKIDKIVELSTITLPRLNASLDQIDAKMNFILEKKRKLGG